MIDVKGIFKNIKDILSGKKEDKEAGSAFEELFRLLGFGVIFVVDLAVSATFFSSLGEGWILIVGGVALAFMKVWNWVEAQSSIGLAKNVQIAAWAMIMALSVYAAINYGLSNTAVAAENDATQVAAQTQTDTLNAELEKAKVQGLIANIGSWTTEKTQIVGRMSSTQSQIDDKTASLAEFRKINGSDYPGTQRTRQTEIDTLTNNIEKDRLRLMELDKFLTEVTAQPRVEVKPVVMEQPAVETKKKLNAEIVFRQTLGDYFKIGIIIFFLVFGTAIELTLATSSIKSRKETEKQRKRRMDKKEKKEEQMMLMREEKDKLEFQRYQIEQSLRLERYRMKMEAKKREIINKITLEPQQNVFDILSMFKKPEPVTPPVVIPPVEKVVKPRNTEKSIVVEEEQVVDESKTEVIEEPAVAIEEPIMEIAEEPVVEVVEKKFKKKIVKIQYDQDPVPEVIVTEPAAEAAESVIEQPMVEPAKPIVEEKKESKDSVELLYIVDKLFTNIDKGESTNLLSVAELTKIIPINKDKAERIYKYLNYIDTIRYEGDSRNWKPKMSKDKVIEIVKSKLSKSKEE